MYIYKYAVKYIAFIYSDYYHYKSKLSIFNYY